MNLIDAGCGIRLRKSIRFCVRILKRILEKGESIKMNFFLLVYLQKKSDYLSSGVYSLINIDLKGIIISDL